MAEQNIEKGDKVAWQWGANKPEGEVAKVVEKGEATVVSHRGNTIKKSAEPGDPAVEISRSGNDVVKNASELEVEEKAGALNGENKGDGKEGAGVKEKEEEKKETNTGEKRDHKEVEKKNGETVAAENDDKKAENGENKLEDKVEDAKAEEDEEENDEEKKEDEPPAKKQKTTDGDADGKKARGRPKKAESNGTNGTKKVAAPGKKKEPKKAATESGEPRRSGRNKA